MATNAKQWTGQQAAAWQGQFKALTAGIGLIRPEEALRARFALYYRRLWKLPRPVRRELGRKLSVSLAGAALMLALGQGEALAAVITVDGATCTLVNAITAANTDIATGGCPAGSGADIVDLQTDVTLTSAATYDYLSDTGLPTITSTMVIAGNDHTIRRNSGAPAFRLFAVSTAGDLTLDNVTLSGALSQRSGGAVYNKGLLAISYSTVSGNSAAFRGGAVYSIGTAAEVDIRHSTLSGITADFDGGAIMNGNNEPRSAGSKVTITNSTLSGNSVGEDGGGIANNEGEVTLIGSGSGAGQRFSGYRRRRRLQPVRSCWFDERAGVHELHRHGFYGHRRHQRRRDSDDPH